MATLAGVAALVPLWPASATDVPTLPGTPDPAVPAVRPARSVAPVVLTGAHVPQWSQAAAVAVEGGVPFSADNGNSFLGGRNAHNGIVVAPPADGRAGVVPRDVVGYRWDGGGWVEVPVQVDERFPYFLANYDSSFGVYSHTDMELTYAWDDERWKRIAGECSAEYPAGEAAMADPVPQLDDDDEIVFMPSDAGPARAPGDAYGPVGTGTSRQEIAVTDPLSGAVSYLYLFTKPGGSATFSAGNGYVSYQRDANGDQWIDRHSFADDDPEKLGSSNTNYGPNVSGTVCDPDGTVRTSTDRFPRDGVTVTTDRYRWRATGRWMVREMHVATPDDPTSPYGPDLIDRWKGRAFQQSPDSSISLVGFEDEQVNWEANSSLLGERVGPVRAIRETWGADSGTNVTKTETFYRDAVAYRYHLRVHPIPPDGLYTSWDYNAGVAAKYYTPLKPDGVDIDGVNDDTGNFEGFAGFPAYVDVADPTLNVPASLLTWEQVSGKGNAGSLVYLLENKGPSSATEPAVVPYYRDDACFDDGTGDDPVARPWPGEATTDQRVKDGYSEAAGGTPYDQLTCGQKQGAYAAHGVHFFATGDTDNAFLPSPQPVNEVDAQQWQIAVPTSAPTNVGLEYSTDVRVPFVGAGVEQASVAARATTLHVTAPASAVAARPMAVGLVLVDDRGAGIAGRSVSVTFQGVAYDATTGADGTASVTVPAVVGPGGPAAVDAVFPGGDGYEPSSAMTSVAVTRQSTHLGVTLDGLRPATRTMVWLTDDWSGALGARPVEVAVNGTRVAQLSTGPDGTASLVLTLKKDDQVTASFAGERDYQGASNLATRT